VTTPWTQARAAVGDEVARRLKIPPARVAAVADLYAPQLGALLTQPARDLWDELETLPGSSPWSEADLRALVASAVYTLAIQVLDAAGAAPRAKWRITKQSEGQAWDDYVSEDGTRYYYAATFPDVIRARYVRRILLSTVAAQIEYELSEADLPPGLLRAWAQRNVIPLGTKIVEAMRLELSPDSGLLHNPRSYVETWVYDALDLDFESSDEAEVEMGVTAKQRVDLRVTAVDALDPRWTRTSLDFPLRVALGASVEHLWPGDRNYDRYW